MPILMYHHLAELPPSASDLERTWTVAPKDFQSQLEMLIARGYHAVSISDLVAYLRKGKPLPSKPIIISFDDGWETDYSVAYPLLKRYKTPATFYVYTNAIGYGSFLKWNEVEEMARGGMEFGSHTLSHPDLRKLPLDAAKKELVDSKALLEKRLGRPISTFAYPSGEYNSQIIQLVKSAGYESAVTIASGYKQKLEDVFTLHRTRVSYTDTLQDLSGRLP